MLDKKKEFILKTSIQTRTKLPCLKILISKIETPLFNTKNLETSQLRTYNASGFESFFLTL